MKDTNMVDDSETLPLNQILMIHSVISEKL